MTSASTSPYESDPSAVWDHVYEELAADAAWGVRSLPALKFAVAASAEAVATRALDCACGDGRNLTDLARAVPFVVGTDVSSVALARAAARLGATGVCNALLMRDDILASNFLDDTFDVVVALEVLSHLRDVPRAIDELIRVCRPGGTVIADVFATTDGTRGDHAGLDYIDDQGVYFRYYDLREATRLCAVSKVSSIQVHQVTWTDPPHGKYRPYEHVHETWCLLVRKVAF